MNKRNKKKLHWLLIFVLLLGAVSVPYPAGVDASADSGGLREIPASGGFKVPAAGKFAGPFRVVVDGDGYVYVTDRYNNRVQKFDSNDNYVAEWGGYGDGEGEFKSPDGIAVDEDGFVYVVDSGNSRVQKFDASGAYVGEWGSGGDGDGQFANPGGIAVDHDGNVYVADSSNDRIQKFGADGRFLAKWGTYGNGNGQFDYPTGVAVDDGGDNVYVTDHLNHRILRFDSEGEFKGEWGEFGDGDGQFKYPMDIAVDVNGIVYVMDTNNRRVQKFDLNGAYVGQWGSNGHADGQFLTAWGIAVSHAGVVYVADLDGNRIQKFDTSGNYISKWGSPGSPELAAESVATDSRGNIYVAEGSVNLVRKFDSSGTLLAEWGGEGSGAGEFAYPASIAIDKNDIVYVADSFNCRVQLFDTEGNFIGEWGSCGDGNGQFDGHGSIAIDGNGFVYVADWGNERIQKFNLNGEYRGQWPIDNYSEWEMEGYYRFGLAADAAGNVYAVHKSGHRVQKFNSTGSLMTEWGSEGSGEGEFGYPGGVAVDGSGNVYVADSDNNRIQKFDSSGSYVTQWGTGSAGDVSLTAPSGVTAGANGLLYVLEQPGDDIGIIRLFSPNNNANAASLTFSDGTLEPAFSGDRTGPYTVAVAPDVNELTVTPLPGDPLATVNVTVSSGTVTSQTTSGGTSFTVPLNVISTPISITVTAADGVATKTYAIHAVRISETAKLAGLGIDQGALSPAFSPVKLSYTANVPHNVTSLNLFLAKEDPSQELTVTGAVYNTVADSVYAYTANLAADVNPIEITVNAPDETSNRYTVNIIREAGAGSGGNENGNGGGTPVAPSPVVSTNGKLTLPAGQAGEVSLGNEVTISVPAGATDREAILTIERRADSLGMLKGRKMLTGSVYEITKSFAGNFNKPVTLTFAFHPTELDEGQRAGIFYYDETNKAWVEVPGSNVNGSRIAAAVDHFKKFTVLSTANEEFVPSFSDIAGHWAKASIERVVKEGVVKGYEDGTFRPDITITRAEFIVMLMNVLKPQGAGAPPSFADEAKIGEWAKQAVAHAASAGIVKGYPDGTFRPDAEITRAEMAAMIAAALDLSPEPAVTGFADDEHIPAWAKGAAAVLRERGLIQGKGSNRFAPGDKATRAEAVTILIHMLETNNESKPSAW
ncbi:S-layer homology domain-containing protein [Paenibacillus arenilitoris]|uniref:S-layer homology domain-containing protein n=1 Tax=Paenibacillus arenilitoris TaxID=2772299 RepID=A0A927CM49_9BACL|nr:S-layer homology domain-containing protein [Paenibacillus arenilitoris]MBD2868701.1 S-layer homology domain-containing protein [Paenibacillus arenilitoris]